MTRKRLIKIILGLIISLIFLYLFLKNLKLEEIYREILNIEGSYLLGAVIVYLAGIWLRSWRWGFILAPIKKVPTKRLYPIYMISYMANNILPLRMGDIYRAYVTGKKEGVSSAATLTTIAVERAFDGVTMLIFLIIIGTLFSPFSPAVNQVIMVASLGFGIILLIMYALLVRNFITEHILPWFIKYFPKKMTQGIRSSINGIRIIIADPIIAVAPEGLSVKVTGLIKQLMEGLEVLKGPRALMLTMIGSLATWIVEALMFYIVLLAFGITQPFYVAMATMAVVNLGIIIPAGPGYVGTFETFCALILDAYGIDADLAGAYALIVHTVQWIPSTLLGLIFMWTQHISFHEISSSE